MNTEEAGLKSIKLKEVFVKVKAKSSEKVSSGTGKLSTPIYIIHYMIPT